MRYSVELSKGAIKIAEIYKKSNPILYKKLRILIDDIAEHPRTGIGHPEPLQKGNSVTYSRQITASDRVIYDINDNTISVLVIKIRGHYNDK
jgi:toxin YoeB